MAEREPNADSAMEVGDFSKWRLKKRRSRNRSSLKCRAWDGPGRTHSTLYQRVTAPLDSSSLTTWPALMP